MHSQVVNDLRLPKSLVDDSYNGADRPLSAIVPIRWRQIIRASLARFFSSRLHTALVAIDLALIALRHWDDYGLLGLPAVHFFLVAILAYEALIFVSGLIYQTLYYRTYYYNVQERSVVIGRGVLCRHEITLPLARITDVYVEQDFFSRLLGLYDIHLSSPTRTSGRAAHMVGVDRAGASALYATIIQLINGPNPIPFT